MKRRLSLVLSAVALTALFTSPAAAQSAKAVSVGISGGAAIPFGDFGEDYTTGYNGTLSLGFNSVGTPLGIRFDAMYNKMGVKDDRTISIPGGIVDAAIITSANANLVYALPGTGIRPYLIGGGGVYGTKLDIDGTGSDPETKSKFGVNGGIGAAFPLSGFNTFVEARLHHIFTDGSATQFIPVTFGLSF